MRIKNCDMPASNSYEVLDTNLEEFESFFLINIEIGLKLKKEQRATI